MAYQKQIWENLPSTNTPINADRLNHMEDGIADAWEHGGGGGGDTLPIGIILPLSSDTIPEGYLLCDGSEISRTTYSTLFSVIGTTYGAGDGSTTFNIPDLQGKVPVGQDSEDTDFDALGETGGGKQTMIPMQWYTDFVDMRIKTGLSIPSWENFRKNASGSTGSSILETSNSAVMGINENTTVDTNGNLQPYIVVKYVIKALNAQTGEVRSESLPVGTELDYDGETVPTGWEQVDDKPVYSTTETICGTWIDGKPLYRKTFSGNLGQTSSLSHRISNINVITKINGAYKNTDSGTQFAIPSVRPSFPNFEVGIYVTTTEIVFDKGAGVTGDMIVFNLILEYTKTTD